MVTSHKKIADLNDNYMNTIFAIIGFMNMYKFELVKSRTEVKLCQGRKFNRSQGSASVVTPDIAITVDDSTGVIGEVKNDFTRMQEHWDDDFRQLMRYDDDLVGWPVPGERVNQHDIVLLVHQSRARKVRDYFLSKAGTELKFTRPFIIIEYNRSDQSQPYFYFRIEHGTLNHTLIHQRLYEGVQVPMSVFVRDYSTIKIYDSEPHLSWMLFLIYGCILDKSTEEKLFQKLNKKIKIPIETTVNEVTQRLNRTYSFQKLHDKHPERQTHYPLKEWVLRAIQKLVVLGDAKWIDAGKGQFVFYLREHSEDIKTHYEKQCLTDEFASQIELNFQEEISPQEPVK